MTVVVPTEIPLQSYVIEGDCDEFNLYVLMYGYVVLIHWYLVCISICIFSLVLTQRMVTLCLYKGVLSFVFQTSTRHLRIVKLEFRAPPVTRLPCAYGCTCTIPYYVMTVASPNNTKEETEKKTGYFIWKGSDQPTIDICRRANHVGKVFIRHLASVQKIQLFPSEFTTSF